MWSLLKNIKLPNQTTEIYSQMYFHNSNDQYKHTLHKQIRLPPWLIKIIKVVIKSTPEIGLDDHTDKDF